MLVLTRKIGESILIDGGIEVCVVSIRGGRVRLGIAAPPKVAIKRDELSPRSKSQPNAPLSVGSSV